MKKTFTLSMSWLHTWAGLFSGWVLFGVLLTGSIAVFHSEVTYWTTPEIRGGLHPSRDHAIAVGQTFLEDNAPDSRLWRITLPTDREPIVKVAWLGEGGNTTRRLDPETGAPITRETHGGRFFYDYHYMVNLSRAKNPFGPVGMWIVGAAGVAMLVGSISGVVVHKRIFKDLFLFRPRASKHRSWLDAHNVLAVLPLPFHILIVYTGLVILYWLYVPAGMNSLYGGSEAAFRRDAVRLEYAQVTDVEPGAPAGMVSLQALNRQAEARFGPGKTAYLTVRDPYRANAVAEAYGVRTDAVTQNVEQVAYDAVTGRELRVVERTPAAKVQSFVAALHYVGWGGPVARWCYFFAGLSAAGMVAAGLVVFTSKRDNKRPAPAWLRQAHAVNVAAVAGVCVASAAFFCIERLTPAAMPNRAEIPVQAFYFALLGCLAHAGLRTPRQAWSEQFMLAAALCVLAPLLGGHGLKHLVERDWVRIWLDLTLWAFAVTFGYCAWTARRKPAGRRAPDLQPAT